MQTAELSPTLAQLFAELVNGTQDAGAFILNSGDAGLLGSIEKLSAAEASQSVNEGATIAAHARGNPLPMRPGTRRGRHRASTMRSGDRFETDSNGRATTGCRYSARRAT